MRKIVIVGGGAFGRELLSWTIAAGAGELAGYVDDAGPAMDGYAGIDLLYLGSVASFDPAGLLLAIAVGDPKKKRQLADALAGRGAQFLTLVHPSAIVTSDAVLDEGAVVGPLTYVATNSRIGRLASVNSLCGIGHDVRIGAYSTISSQVDVTGGVQLGEAVFVGSGARILPGLKIGAQARIGAGSVVTRHAKDGQTLFAPPARTL
ncbi:MAG TPA: NeuD/PglB/VioB family sugar acetyltransferase [Sphingomonas sp.]|nr:NeuD/PglB/VioB family sugar acetyltransferase [Sphingomonas sp.]